MNDKIKTVADLISALSKFDSSLPICGYCGDDLEHMVYLIHLEPSDEELAGGTIEQIMVCLDDGI